MFKEIILFALFFFLPGFFLKAQNIERVNSFSYSVNEGLMQSSISDIAVDKNNFCWISFPNGIQKFDGINFTDIPIQEGLPDDKWVNFFKTSKGDLLLSHTKGISLYRIANNNFRLVYKIDSAHINPAFFIGEYNDIVYYYSENGSIKGIDVNNQDMLLSIDGLFPGYVSNGAFKPQCSNIVGGRLCMLVNNTFSLVDLKKQKIVASYTPPVYIINFFIFFKSANELFYFEPRKDNRLQLHLYNFENNTDKELLQLNTNNKLAFRCNVLQWQNKMLMSIYNSLYEVDSSMAAFKSEFVNFQNQPIGDNASISKIKEDNFGNLFMTTINGGIRKIIRNNYPIKYYGTASPADNFILSILPDKKSNRVLAGTAGKGLLVFDTLQHLIKQITTLPGRNLSFSPNGIVKDVNGDYLLFIWGEKNIWRLSSNLENLNSTPITSSIPDAERGIEYYSNFLGKDENFAYLQTQGKLYKANFINHEVAEYKLANGSALTGIFYNAGIVLHNNDELILIDSASLKITKKIPFKNTGGVRCFAADRSGNLFIGSNKGVFKTDRNGKILQHLNKGNGLPDDCIYALAVDDDGFLWGSTNKGIFKVNKDNHILQLKKEDGLQENEFNTNVVSKAADGELYFGGVNGVNSFYPAAVSSFKEQVNLLITRIRINNNEIEGDTAVWNLNKLDLNYQENSLAFDFVAMASYNAGQYIYQYKMSGIDNDWIQNKDLQTVRYYLPPGKYVFQLYASRFFNKEAKPMKEIMIIIHQPFWKTWWFRLFLAVIVLSVMAYFINQYNQKKYRQKLAILEQEQQMRSERERISRDLHDNIGAYANAVIYNTELLEKEQENSKRNYIMKDLKFASKDIITSLRETIWALNKDNYTAEDCLLRIRNFIQPFTRYYQHIKFEIAGEVPRTKSLHYTKALNLVRIVQESVTNGIKHSDATRISIISNSRDGHWEMEVTDNGNGFDQQNVDETSQGNGLKNMKQRARDAGFELIVKSLPGTGTSVLIRIPQK